MSDPERFPDNRPHGNEPSPANVLPPELADFLRDKEFACVTEATDRGTVLVMKMPGADIQSVRGRVPIWIHQELYAHPAAPVIRMVVTFFDQPESPLALETFINVGDEAQRANLAALADQDELVMLLYDEALTHQLTKVVPYQNREVTAQILHTAERLLGTVPREHFDFDAAKAAVMARASL